MKNVAIGGFFSCTYASSVNLCPSASDLHLPAFRDSKNEVLKSLLFLLYHHIPA
jgi:hypothetical protein